MSSAWIKDVAVGCLEFGSVTVYIGALALWADIMTAL